MVKPINRRDLLKLAALTSLVGVSPRVMPKFTFTVQESARPNVLVIVFDTLSAKHMSLYGYPRETTPNLERFAKHSTVFMRHYAGGNFTSPGTSSLLTGAYPWSQRGFNFMATVAPEYERQHLFRVFGDAGYYCFAYTHNWLAAQLLNQFSGDIDFLKPTRDLCIIDTEVSDQLFPKDHNVALATERVSAVRSTYGTGSLFLSMIARAGESIDQESKLAKYASLFPNGLPTNQETTFFVIEDAIDWIQNELKHAPRPFFGYFHLLPPHEPYNPRREFIGRFANEKDVEPPKPLHPLGTTFDEPAENAARRHYDEFLAYADSEFGRLYDFLSQEGILDNTYVVFTSDHGQILERGTRGHITPLLYESITHVPLIISSPGQTMKVEVSTPTSCLDILPTLARIAGQPIPSWAEGELLPTFGGKGSDERSIFTVEAKDNAKQAPLTVATVSMIKGGRKLIHYLGYDKGYSDQFELYDLEKDPEELTDLNSTDWHAAPELKRELAAKLEQVNSRYRHT